MKIKYNTYVSNIILIEIKVSRYSIIILLNHNVLTIRLFLFMWNKEIKK